MNNQPLLILLYSNNSPKCDQLRTMLKDEHLSFFKIICVDNPRIRDMINNSTTIKISSVPCVLEFFPNGQIASYEDNKAFEWMANFISIIEKKPEPKQPHIQDNLLSASGDLDKIHSMPPPRVIDYTVGDDVSSMAPLKKQGLQNQEITINDKQADLSGGIRRGPKRTAYRGMIDENNEFQGISSERDMHEGELQRPRRGQGHENMSSSLHDTTTYKNKIKMIEDVDDIIQESNEDDDYAEIDDSDPSGMKMPRGDNIISNERVIPNNDKRNKSKEKSANIKNLAASLERARSKEEKMIESYKQGKNSTQRTNANTEPINI